jgi:ATP phosphoribosyltransferase
LQENGISASIVKIAGSVEAAPALGLADAVCDIAQTGKTLELNNLRIIEKVYESTAVLLKNDDFLEDLAS